MLNLVMTTIEKYTRVIAAADGPIYDTQLDMLIKVPGTVKTDKLNVKATLIWIAITQLVINFWI